MHKLGLALLIAAAACGNHDNLILGTTLSGKTASGVIWPILEIDTVNSAIGSQIHLFDAKGNPTGEEAWVVIVSDQSNLCATLKANRNFFHQPTTGFVALILFMPVGKLGTFVIGRAGDEGTNGLLVGAPGAQAATAPFEVLNDGRTFEFISVTNWDDGAANGNFQLYFVAPNARVSAFQGQYKTTACDGLDGVILP
jgi:hypothetical protein